MMSARQLWTSKIVRVGAIVAVLAGALTINTADAAAPAQGTVSTTDPQVTWSGGPFAVPNATGNALDTPDCTAPQSCDNYLLHVDTPAGYGTTHALHIDVSWTNTASDFDVYVLDSKGNSVGTSASSADPEQVILPPTAGTYTVRVVPYLPAGSSYTAKATLTDLPANPAPGTDTPPTFTNYAAPSSFAAANDAGEPSIGTSFKTDKTFYQAGLSTAKVTFDDSASPATATWQDVSADVTKGCPEGSTTSLDPILFTDHVTGRTLESQLSGQDSLTCTTDNDGASWLPSQGGGIPSGVDHQSIGGGPYAKAGLGKLPTATYPQEIYYCSQDIATAFCATSQDGGTTFGAGVPTYNLLTDGCGGLHGHVKVGPDGSAYVPNKSCGTGQAAVVSQDNGESWTVRPVPGTTSGDSDPSVGISANNTVYFGYVGADGKPGVAVSRDHGKTWTDRQNVGTEFGVKSAVFPAMVAGDDDRASFAYLGTPDAGSYQATTFDGTWHLYIDTTYDGGKTWVTTDATPNDAVQRGSICTAGTTCGDNRNLLDFIDTTIDDHGRVEVAYADGCIKTCVSETSQNSNTKAADQPDAHAAYATIARQSGGKPLFAKYDPAGSTTTTSPSVPVAAPNVRLSSLRITKAGHGKRVATMTVRDTGNRTFSDVRVRVLDNLHYVGGHTITKIAPGVTKSFTVTWRPGSKRVHHVGARVDPRNKIRETNETDNALHRTFRR
jgi:hypothetical protein